MINHAVQKGINIMREQKWHLILLLFMLLLITGGWFFFLEKEKTSKVPVVNETIADTGAPSKVATAEESRLAVSKEASSSDTALDQLPQVKKDPVEIPASVSPPDLVWPAQGPVMTPFGFGYSETFADMRFHQGVDILLPEGSEVKAAGAGRVNIIQQNDLWGKTVVIKHEGGLETRYRGIKPVNIRPGQHVDQGEVIAAVDLSPPYEARMKPHLHWEVYQSGKALDPEKF